MPSGRIFRFTGFIGSANANKVCARGPKKLMIDRIFVKIISLDQKPGCDYMIIIIIKFFVYCR